jgi:hypothetical protein
MYDYLTKRHFIIKTFEKSLKNLKKLDIVALELWVNVLFWAHVLKKTTLQG